MFGHVVIDRIAKPSDRSRRGLGMRAGLGTLATVATVAASALLAAAPASASHSHPATYTGSVRGGGSVGFDVSGDGSAITSIQLNVPSTGCGALLFQFIGSVPIVDHAFSYADPTLRFSGSFPAPQTARGTIQTRGSFPACSLQNWSATTPAQPTPTPTPTPTPLAPDTTAPVIALSGRTTQRAGRTVTVSVTSNEFGSATAKGAVIVRRTRRTATRFALRSAVTQLAPNIRARLTLRVPSRAQTAIRKALRRGKRVTALVRVGVRDPAGNRARGNRTVRLRRSSR